METSPLDELSAQILELSTADQDHLASMLLMERLKRNKLVMPTLHQRIDDAESDNWKQWDKATDAS